MANSYEVELKFRVAQLEPIWDEVHSWGATAQDVVHHCDRYFNHPARDFRSTDEAFRIRTIGDDNFVTYKGAVLGTVAKTRHEIEVEFAKGSQATEQLIAMMTLLGFRFVREVRKSRRNLQVSWNQREFELALDDVPGLGRFVEIELIANDENRHAAEAAVWDLARTLNLSDPEPRSYLDLLLEFNFERR